MRELFKDIPESCDNTLLIAERCNVKLRENENLLPAFEVPEGETEDTWLRKESVRGLLEKMGDRATFRMVGSTSLTKTASQELSRHDRPAGS